MNAAASATAGGLFNGTRIWAVVVNRDGELCAHVASTPDPTQVWPGSQAIAKAKAYTANAFSLDTFALSTARLYTFESYTAKDGKWRGDLTTNEHTKSLGVLPLFGGREVTSGFVGTYSDNELEAGGTALVGKTSVMFHARLIFRSEL